MSSPPSEPATNGLGSPVDDTAVNGDVAADVPTYSELFPPLPDADVATGKSLQSSWAVAAVRSSDITQVFQVPIEEQLQSKADRGFGGDHQAKIVKEVMDRTKTSIDVTKSRDRTLCVVIKGKRDNVAQAKKQLLSKLQTQASTEVSVPRQFHRILIGRGGDTLRKLQDETATTIRVPKADENSDIVRISGTAENCRKAAHRIQLMSDQQANKDIIDLEIIKAYHTLIAGYKNSNVQQIEAATGARIHIPPQSVDKDTITITGEKPGVQIAAAQISAIYEDKKRTCGELTTPVKRSQHRFVIGPKGKNVADIFERTGVVVEVPRPEAESDDITLRGTQANLVQALTLVYEYANSIVQETIEVPAWVHRHLIGPKGETLKNIIGDNSNVHVNFDDKGDDIELEGPPSEVNAVKTGLLQHAAALQAKLAFKEVRVDRKFHPHLIGRSGQTIRKIRNDTGANISMPKEDSVSDTIRVEGTTEAVDAAAKLIAAIAKKLENAKEMDLIIPQKLHSQLIGAGGKTVQEITKKFNDIAIDIPNSKTESEIVTLRGDRKDVDAAADYIKKLVKRLEEENYSEKVTVFKQFHKNIIGAKGMTIRQIKDETNTRIQVPAENSNDDGITIIGLKKDVERARDRILQIQSEMASIVTEEVEIPTNIQKLIRGKVANSVSSDCGNVNIHFPSKGDKVTIRGPEEDVAKAKTQLSEIAAEQAVHNHSEELKVKPDYHRYLIGRGGAMVKKIQEESGARVIFPRGKDSADDTITLLGKAEACKSAKELISKRVTELENTVEDTMDVDPEYHKNFLANRQQFLRDLADEFGGVQVTVPRQNSKSSTLTVKGSKSDVPLAKQRISEFIEELKNRITIEVTIPQEYHRSVVGGQGRNVRKVCEDFNVNVKFPKRPERKTVKSTDAEASSDATETDAAAAAEETAPETSDVVTITGSPDNCEKAKDALLALVPVSEAMQIEADYHRSIIGTKGEGLKKMLGAYPEVNVKFPDARGDSDEVVIRGPKDLVDVVRGKLEERVKELDADKEERALRSFKVEVRVNPQHHPTLIGRRGETINQIRKEYDVQIDFPRRDQTDEDKADLIIVTGYEEKAKEAAADIERRAAELDKLTSEVVQIHPSIHRRIIGFKGQNVKALQETHNVRIEFSRDDKDSPDITIIGMPDDVEYAREELLMLEEEYIDEIREMEETQRYIKPTREPEVEKKAQSGPFKVRDAPWEMAKESFPTLGGGAGASSAPKGAWGRAK